MPKLGKKTFLVSLICAKTKISAEDVVDVIAALPACMAEAFIHSNPPESKGVDLGAVSAQWKAGSGWGAYISLKPTKSFKIHFTKLRYEGKYPLAIKLYSMMNKKSKERVIKKGAAGGYNNSFD